MFVVENIYHIFFNQSFVIYFLLYLDILHYNAENNYNKHYIYQKKKKIYYTYFLLENNDTVLGVT